MDYELKTIGDNDTTTDHDQSQFDTDSSSNARDRYALARLGKKQVLKRNFGYFSMLAFSTTVLVTWEGVLGVFSIGLVNGGPAGLVYGYIVVWVGTLSVFISISELASMAPTAGGQYHWVAILAPKSSRKFLSYLTGWMTAVAWQATIISGVFLAGTQIQGLLVLNYSNYVFERWHGTLLAWACLLVSVFINTVVASLLPSIESVILILHVLGFFAVLIIMAYSAPRSPASNIFTVFLNEGSWDTQGLSFLIGLMGLVYTFVGADAAVHMSEEMQNAAVNVPRAIIGSIILNGILGFAILLVTLFGLGDVESILNTPTGYPFIQIFYQATRSPAGASAMTCIIITLAFCATVGFVATSSRMIWSFARDRGLPFSNFLSRLNKRSVPINSISITTLLAVLFNIINIGSTTVLNDILSISIAGFYSTYFASCALLLYRRLLPPTGPSGGISNPTDDIGSGVITTSEGVRLVWGPWHVPGWFGIANNAFACAYMIVVLTFSFWPNTDPTSASTMNYSVLVTGSVVVFSVIYYGIWGRRSYRGPVVEIDAMVERPFVPVGTIATIGS